MATRHLLGSTSALLPRRPLLTRHVSSFVPPAALERGIDPPPTSAGPRTSASDAPQAAAEGEDGSRPETVAEYGPQVQTPLVKPYVPSTPHFYSAKVDYYTKLQELEELARVAKYRLTDACLLPPPRDIAKVIQATRPKWKKPDELWDVFKQRLRVRFYKRLIPMLDELGRYRSVAGYAGLTQLHGRIEAEISQFSDNVDGVGKVRTKRYKELDEFGRSYAHGARKTSTARVWMIATDPTLPTARPFVPAEGTAPSSTASVQESQPSTPDSSPESSDSPLPSPSLSNPAKPTILTSQILINRVPLPIYFTSPTLRELVIRPLRVTGLLGAFNIFALVHGGGTTGQAEAVAVAIGRAIMAHAPQMKGPLSKAGAVHRDPRMVERKKPGLMKARRAYTWVKR